MLKAKVNSNKDGKVSLSLEDGQSLVIPENEVGKATKEGDTIHILLTAPGLENEATEKLAKDLLNQLIK